jgi:hypothetical protein
MREDDPIRMVHRRFHIISAHLMFFGAKRNKIWAEAFAIFFGARGRGGAVGLFFRQQSEMF